MVMMRASRSRLIIMLIGGTALTQLLEEEIRRRSYLIWLKEGRPFGDELKHWQRAKAEIEAKAEARYEAYLFR